MESYNLYIFSIAPHSKDIRDKQSREWFYTKCVPDYIAQVIEDGSYQLDEERFRILYTWLSHDRPFERWNKLDNRVIRKTSEVYVVDISKC